MRKTKIRDSMTLTRDEYRDWKIDDPDHADVIEFQLQCACGEGLLELWKIDPGTQQIKITATLDAGDHTVIVAGDNIHFVGKFSPYIPGRLRGPLRRYMEFHKVETAFVSLEEVK